MNELAMGLLHRSQSLPWNAWAVLSATTALFFFGVPAISHGIPIADWRSLLKFWGIAAMMSVLSLMAIACLVFLLIAASL